MLRQEFQSRSGLPRLGSRVPGEVQASPGISQQLDRIMRNSKYNIFSKLKGQDDYILINSLTKQADILPAELAADYESGTLTDTAEFVEKGYLVDEADEARRYREAYLEFIENRDTDEVQVFFVPSYACNFACTYCYQESYDHAKDEKPSEITGAFFRWIDTHLAGRNKYITIFGGEPLMPSERSRLMIRELLEGARERNLDTAIVTNGYELGSYVPLLKEYRIREVQVTLDGVGDLHDKRRFLHGGGKTFDTIVAGIDAALAAGISINLRAVVDKQNLPGLPELARFSVKRGWTASGLFKTQLGRNYELHSCQADQQKLYSRLSMYEDLYNLILENPDFLEFHRPAYSISKYLFENGEMPDPLFDSCPGTKTEWALDYTGKVYSCTATVGKEDEVLGTFYPEFSMNEEAVEEWEERDVTTIPKCADCSLQLACGGGCASVAKNATGDVLSPDCRPVDALIGMGIPLYFQETNTATNNQGE